MVLVRWWLANDRRSVMLFQKEFINMSGKGKQTSKAEKRFFEIVDDSIKIEKGELPPKREKKDTRVEDYIDSIYQEKKDEK